MITDDVVINRNLYQLAKKMLLHRSGTKYEDMYWLNQETGEIVASETQMYTEEEITYSNKTKYTLKRQTGLVTIHSHPMGLPPSVDDFNANYKYGYCFGGVVGHNCRVFFTRVRNGLMSCIFPLPLHSIVDLDIMSKRLRLKLSVIAWRDITLPLRR